MRRASRSADSAAAVEGAATPALLVPFLARVVEARCAAELELSAGRDGIRRVVAFTAAESEAAAAAKRALKQHGGRGDGAARARTVFVGGVDDRVEEADLHELFSQVALVQGVRLPENEGGRRRGFAFVELASTRSVLYACLALNGLVLHGRALRCQPSGSDDSGTKARQLCVRNLDERADEVALYEAFSELAEVTGVRLQRDSGPPRGGGGGGPEGPSFGRSRGFGFVWFASAEGAENALAYAQSGRAVLGGRLLHVERCGAAPVAAAGQ